MPDHSVHKAGELPNEQRLLVERLLGRALADDETISVNAYRPHPAPARDKRAALRQEIVIAARDIGSRAQDLNEEDLDALIDEATTAVRSRSD
jgi:hypothetical protein